MDEGCRSKRMEGMTDRTEREVSMAKECIALIIRKMNREMTREEYYFALLELDRKYPMPGHPFGFTKEEYEKCHLHEIQPESFKEAAEMYVRHEQRVDRENPDTEKWKKKLGREWTELPKEKCEPDGKAA